jgi:hypothetical protein
MRSSAIWKGYCGNHEVKSINERKGKCVIVRPMYPSTCDPPQRGRKAIEMLEKPPSPKKWKYLCEIDGETLNVGTSTKRKGKYMTESPDIHP